MKNETGYAHFNYAASQKEFGSPRLLTQGDGWILERLIPGTAHRDAMGCYPLFACRDWSNLHADLEEIGNDLVSLVLVADPFGDYDVGYLRNWFMDVCVPFKEHFVVDLGRKPSDFVEPHHRRNARRALGDVSVEVCADPTRMIDYWFSLYSNLVARHEIRGLAAFSRESFAKQLAVPKGLLSQTYPNIELILFDDGSSDGSWGKICSYEGRLRKKFPRVILERHENIGAAPELELALGRATGDLLCILESDDYYLPEKSKRTSGISTSTQKLVRFIAIQIISRANVSSIATGKGLAGEFRPETFLRRY